MHVLLLLLLLRARESERESERERKRERERAREKEKESHVSIADGRMSVVGSTSCTQRGCHSERLVIYCRTRSVSAAHATHCAAYCTSCRPRISAFPGATCDDRDRQVCTRREIIYLRIERDRRWKEIRHRQHLLRVWGFGAEGLGFGVQDLGFGGQGLWFRV